MSPSCSFSPRKRSKHLSVQGRRHSRSRSRSICVPKYSLGRHSKSRSRSQSRYTLPTGYRTPKKSVDTIQNLDTSLNRNQNLDGSERSMHHHDGNRSPPRNKSIRGNRHSKSRTRSKTPINGQKKSPYHDRRTITHCDNAESPKRVNKPKHLRVPPKRHSRSRSKSRSRSRSRSRTKTPEKIVDASRSVDTSLERSIDTSQNLELSDMSTHRDDGNRSLPCNNSIRAKRDCRSRSSSLSKSLKPSQEIPSEFTDCGLDDSRTLSTSLTFDDRDEEAFSSGPDSQNNGYKGPSLRPRQSDTSPSSRRRSLRNCTKVTPTNCDSIIEQTLVDQGHTRQTRKSRNKYSDSSTMMSAPVRLQYEEGRPPVPSAADSGNDIGTEQTSGDQGHTRLTRQSRNKYSDSSTVMPAPVHLEYQEGRPPLPSAPDSSNDIGTEQTSGDQGHTRLTRQSRNKYSDSSTVMPAPVHLEYQEGRPPLPSAPDSSNDIGTEQTSGDQGHTRQTRQSRDKHSNSSTVMPAPVRLQNQEGRPPLPSAPDSGTDKMDIKSTFASNPKGLSLSQFDKLFKRNGMKLVTVPGNGFCFISCVLVTLAEQGINKSLDVLSVEIMIEITNHLAHYKQYGNKKDMTTFLAKCADYFQKGIYDSDAVDICIGATANALGINVHVLQKSNDKKRVHMSSFLCLHSSSMDIYLHHYPGKLKGKSLDAHFNCYVNKDYSKKNSKSIASRIVRTDESGIDSSNIAPNADQR